MLVAILSVEALEDNEVLIVEGVRHISRINDPRNRAIFEALAKPNIVSILYHSSELICSSINIFVYEIFLLFLYR